MAIFDVFSKRTKLRPAQLAYGELPPELRAQCAMLLKEVLAIDWNTMNTFDEIVRREHPIPSFQERYQGRFSHEQISYALECLLRGTFDEAIDALEVGLRLVSMYRHGETFWRPHFGDKAGDALAEANGRFLEHGVGYQFSIEQNQIIQIDSELLQAEAVTPAMKLLTSPGFEGANEEFAEAHAHYRAGRLKDAVAAAVKALESTAKGVISSRGWTMPTKPTMKPLLDELFAKSLFPSELQTYFAGLRSALEAGVPTIGNSNARHGQGASVREMPPHVASFAMHLAAASIVFILRSHEGKPR